MKMILFVVLILLSSNVLAISGVNPRSYEVDFVPNYEGNFSFSFNIDKYSKVDLYLEGELAKYVSLDKEKISGREKVVALLRLPSEIDSPGVNQIRIVARDVVSVIKINVPYPEKYIELKLNAPNINVEEKTNIDLGVFSKGNKSVVVEPKIEIYKVGDWRVEDEEGRELIEVIEIDSNEIMAGESMVFKNILDCYNYSAGEYVAVAVVNYSEEIAMVENSFKIGELLVEVLNYTKEFRENKIDKFEIEVESFWDDNIDELYAEINIIGEEGIKFTTPVIELKRWRNGILSGFLDTREIPGYEVDAEIILYYNGEANSQIVKLKILKGFDYVFFGVIIGCLIILGFVIWRGKGFLKKYRELKGK